MLLQLTLALVLLALPGSLQQDGDCTESKERNVRLRGETSQAGRVEVCWRTNGAAPYKWQTVCGGKKWGIDEARVVCSQLGYTNSTAADCLLCKKCNNGGIGQGTGTRLKLRCNKNTRQPCTMKSIRISPCSGLRHARVVCAIPSGLSQANMAAKRREVVGGILGAVIIAMVIILLSTNLGWAWFYHWTSKQRINKENVTPNEAQESNHICGTLACVRPSQENPTSSLSHIQLPQDDYTPGMAADSVGAYAIAGHNHHTVKSGATDRTYHTLEGPAPIENTDEVFCMSAAGEERDWDHWYTSTERLRKRTV